MKNPNVNHLIKQQDDKNESEQQQYTEKVIDNAETKAHEKEEQSQYDSFYNIRPEDIPKPGQYVRSKS